MPPITLLVKPASSLCNMACAYCFYADVSEHRLSRSFGVMQKDTLEALIRRAFQFADGFVSFAFQGGEPTLAGLPFFQTVVELERKYNARGLRVQNALQTNGLLLDDAFCAFLAQNGFLTGLSMDGTEDIHDALRKDARLQGTYARVRDAARRMQKHGAEFNILCVVSASVARAPARVFDALREYRYLQFIPCLDALSGERGAHALSARDYGEFLKTLFDQYYDAWRAGAYVSVRDFDNYILRLRGELPEACGMQGACQHNFVIEADGGVYPCDFYVLDEWRMGNIREHSLARLAKSAVADRFIEVSRHEDEGCKACRYRALCRGGCRRHREPFVSGAPGRNVFCESYKALFEHAFPRMLEMARHER